MSNAWTRIAPSVWLVALILTGLNAIKPLTIDDGAFFQYAQQIAQHPFDPYGFDLFWYNEPTPAIEILAPAGLPYWWALGQTLFGQTPWLWKCWLFPFALLLCWAVRDLSARFAPGGETPLLATLVLAPTIVPAFNLMLDIPSLALALGGAAVFMRACDDDRLSVALLAGVLGGLALQTKFTTIAPVASFYVYGLLTRRWRLVLIAGCVTAGIFVSWEGLLFARYGDSHFLFALNAPVHDAWKISFAMRVIGWIALFGALAWPAALIALISLGATPLRLAFAIGFASLPFAMIALATPTVVPIPLTRIVLGAGDRALDLFFVGGLAVCGILITAIAAGLRRAGWRPPLPTQFMLLWLAIELLACFVNSPFHASRRMIGPALVATLTMAHLASSLDGRGPLLRLAAAWSVALGLLFGVSDIADSRARWRAQDAIASELERLGHDADRGRVWFTGHWGFQFYSEQRGYRPLIAEHSRVMAGDFVLLPLGVSMQPVPKIALSEAVGVVTASSGFPLSTIPNAYQGPVPIRRQPQLQLRVSIHRVLADGLAAKPGSG
jgi:hypothetical protein